MNQQPPETDDAGPKANGLGPAADDFYAALMQLHAGLSFEQSSAMNARLVLLMANEIADWARISAVFRAAAELPLGDGPTESA